MDIGEIASPRKRGWEALVYRVAGLRRPRARRLHRMNSPTARACIGCCPPPSTALLVVPVASPPPPTSPSCTQQRPYPLACAVLYARGSYGAAIGEEAGDSRDAQVSHARRCCRATSDEEARHSLPRPSRAPPASDAAPSPPSPPSIPLPLRRHLFPSDGLRAATTDAHDLSGAFAGARARGRGFRSTRSVPPSPLPSLAPPRASKETPTPTRHESTPLPVNG